MRMHTVRLCIIFSVNYFFYENKNLTEFGKYGDGALAL
jgi:hypothetical protein